MADGFDLGSLFSTAGAGAGAIGTGATLLGLSNPVTLPITLGLTALGSYFSANEANKNAKAAAAARNAATLAEVNRDQQWATQNRGSFDKSLDLFGPQASADNLTKAQTDIGSVIAANTPDAAKAGLANFTTANAPKAATADASQKLGGVITRLGNQATATGNLKGYDQQIGDNSRALNQSGRDINTVNNFAQGSGNVAKLEQNAASTNAVKSSSGIGDLLSFAGNTGSYAAGGGKIGLPNFTGTTTLPSGSTIPGASGPTSVNGAPLF